MLDIVHTLLSKIWKREFGRRNNELAKVAKLERIEQEERTMEEFVQKIEKSSQEK